MWEPIRETTSHITRQGTLGHSRLGSLSHCGLILAYNVELVCASGSLLLKKKVQTANRQTFPQSPRKRKEEKKPSSKSSKAGGFRREVACGQGSLTWKYEGKSYRKDGLNRRIVFGERLGRGSFTRRSV